MIWDDHDIIAGYGSYHPNRQLSLLMQGIFKVAREYFWAFQMKGVRRNLLRYGSLEPWRSWDGIPGPYTHFCTAGSIGFLLLDNRFERSSTQIMSRQSHDEIGALLSSIHGLRHLMVVIPSPLVFSTIGDDDEPITKLPNELDDLDDLRDSWHAKRFRAERDRLVRKLFDFSQRTGAHVVTLCGGAGVGSLGRITSKLHERVIYQPISSPLVRANPNTKYRWSFNFNSSTQTVNDIEYEMLKFKDQRFIWKQNFLSLLPQEDAKYLAVWFAMANQGKNAGPGSEEVFTFLLDYE